MPMARPAKNAAPRLWTGAPSMAVGSRCSSTPKDCATWAMASGALMRGCSTGSKLRKKKTRLFYARDQPRDVVRLECRVDQVDGSAAITLDRRGQQRRDRRSLQQPVDVA